VTMLAEHCDVVVGVDTHRDTHTAAFVDRLGGVGDTLVITADRRGYRTLLAASERQAPRRVWAVEGTGSYGAGLTRFLRAAGEEVVEVERPVRSARRIGKSDALDAVRAARDVLAREQQIEPRAHGDREAIRVLLATRQGAVVARTQAINQLRALVVTAPEPLRSRLTGLPAGALLDRCARMRTSASMTAEHEATVVALRACARRAQACGLEADELERRLLVLVRTVAPALLDEPGIGPISAAAIVLAWSHHGRIRNDAAFAQLAGVAPIPASSGQTVRHRLNRGGDRQLNRALHTIVLARVTCHAETRAYVERRRAEGKTPREIRRCLKRYVARRVYKVLEHNP
jgi:transposase